MVIYFSFFRTYNRILFLLGLTFIIPCFIVNYVVLFFCYNSCNTHGLFHWAIQLLQISGTNNIWAGKTIFGKFYVEIYNVYTVCVTACVRIFGYIWWNSTSIITAYFYILTWTIFSFYIIFMYTRYYKIYIAIYLICLSVYQLVCHFLFFFAYLLFSHLFLLFSQTVKMELSVEMHYNKKQFFGE